jgi:hypothetical protein
LLLLLVAGCGTTRVTDTQRTATEQLLVSQAVDQAVTQLDFRILTGKLVYFDPQYMDGAVDRGYVVSSLRQHLLACGCILVEDRTKATYVVEARTGGIGTDRHALLFGVPQMNVPTFVPGQPSSIPEIPIAKKTDQKGIAKIAVFAYNRLSGRPVWQSGVVQAVSTAKDTWVLGAGPIQGGTIRDNVEFAGQHLDFSLTEKIEEPNHPPSIDVTHTAAFVEPLNVRAMLECAGACFCPAMHRADNWHRLCKPRSSDIIPASGILVAPTSAAGTPPAKPPTPPPTPNAGGAAETEPARIEDSGWFKKPL